MTNNLLIGLVAAAIAEAEIAAQGLRDTVIPAWPPARRTFPQDIARRLERAEIFEGAFADDLGTFLGSLAAKIKSEMYIGWEADENHNRGGYEVLYADEETHALIRCANDLQSAREAITAVLYGVRAMRVADELLDA
ncbi:hypothetical protein JSE7799_02704 [Jannaschia seosinensis]|uniref:Uncharacterized protein n=1 Tax=Jannaschia seosinensis TaxID=313367 RepID=A0A0M7BF25_9RHOB|nr:hypothetical protein [Jannaschia seosinensis]CUH39975.1 hypothetical protein JSE7799_02704 [Jannaschia seosinensis]